MGSSSGRSSEGLAAVLVERGSVRGRQARGQARARGRADFVVRLRRRGRGAIATGAGLRPAILWTKLMTGAIAVGCARASFEYAAKYATEREAFGKPIGAFQAHLLQDRRHGDRGRRGADVGVAGRVEDRSGRGDPRDIARGERASAARRGRSAGTTACRSSAATATSGTTPSRSGSGTR